MTKNKGVLRIGTSGIVVPGSKENFPEEFKDKSRMNYYASLFNTLEVNSTFRKPPMVSTLEKWRVDVPEEFQFTIKLWKEITHIKQLKIDLDKIDTFLEIINHIGAKRGCLLIQFPGSITAEYEKQVQEILGRVNAADKLNSWRKAIEFRSTTWYKSDIDKMIANYKAAMVLHDMPKSKKLEVNDDEPFSYFRFHGPKGDYRGSYSNEFLKEQAQNIQHVLKKGKDVYVYFNNTMGDAFENAMNLKAMIEQ